MRVDRNSGQLWFLNLNDGTIKQALPNVLDIAKMDGQLWLLRNAGPTHFKVEVLGNAQSTIPELIASGKNMPLFLSFRANVPVVMSSDTAWIYSGDSRAWRAITLSSPLKLGVQQEIVILENGTAYAGANLGEWGGGLQRVDLTTGTVSTIEKRESNQLCSGPLNSECDPVTSVIPDAINANCVIAAVGLSHFLTSGRILRVCGSEVSVIWARSVKTSFGNRAISETLPIFGLAVNPKGGFWSVSPGELHSFRSNGEHDKKIPMPKLRKVSGVALSTDIEGIVVVSTDANWAVSLSGYTPLVASRD
jgi:hypothetical protein